MRWQCEYINQAGRRCESEAVYRLQYALSHPFDHVDCCVTHLVEYHHPSRVEELEHGVS